MAVFEGITRKWNEFQKDLAERRAERASRDLFEAMKQVVETGKGPEEQIPSMGCSIKWKISG